MNLDNALKIVKSALTKERYEHTVRVVEQAHNLAQLNGVDVKKATVAAALHDYAKNRPVEELKFWIINSDLPKDLLNYHHELWHAPVGAKLIAYEHSIDCPEIQSAVRYHTTGRAHMSMLETVVYTADFIEPGRKFPGVEEIREVATEHLVKAAWMISKHTMHYLLNNNSRIYPDSLHTYNDLSLKVNWDK